jgi:hypothetical protein
MRTIRIIRLPKKGTTSRYEAREGSEIFDITNRKEFKNNKEEWSWRCSCGVLGCRHIQAAKAVHFAHKKRGSGETAILEEMKRMPGFSAKFNPEI